ncbi:glucose-6-phosphate isomerase [bacterium]|nr:glucose-6-phosphate isomerase [bacterium]
MKNELVFDFSNLTESKVGEQGIPDSLIDSSIKKARDVDADIERQYKNGGLPYRDLPAADIQPLIRYAGKALGHFENFINVGIGGSALGAQALVMALRHPFHNLLGDRKTNGMRMFFADNIDPDYLYGMLDVCEPRKTLYNIITKSGSTAETMGTFLLVKTALEKTVGASWRDHIVITTDHAKGDLRKIADSEHIDSFEVPDGVGGRFSVLTPVGLLPAACAGIDITGLLDGAAVMKKRLDSAGVMDNPVYLYSLYQYLLDTARGKRISVMMPYSNALYGLADWYRQLWAESLGKKVDLDGAVVNVGPTPVKALGVTDQHSQVQLYVEGPFDKVFTILAVGAFRQKLPMEPSYEKMSSLEYLGGRSMAELIEAERLGTVYALTSAQRPNMTITFPEVTPSTVGQFLYAFQTATVFSGGLYHINPLDQPGVEAGKIAAFALMGRPGYEAKAAEIRKGLGGDTRYVK